MTRLLASTTCFTLAIVVQAWVASDPVVHVLVQFPLLAAAGYLLSNPQKSSGHARAPMLLVALFAGAIWMLPRSLDAALSSDTWHLAKFVSLPLLVGLPLGVSWPGLGPVLRGILKAQSVSMLLFLGFLYTHAPIRICNSYLLGDQYRLGIGFVIVAAALVVFWITPAFVGQTTASIREPRNGLPRHCN